MTEPYDVRREAAEMRARGVDARWGGDETSAAKLARLRAALPRLVEWAVREGARDFAVCTGIFEAGTIAARLIREFEKEMAAETTRAGSLGEGGAPEHGDGAPSPAANSREGK